jgi:hypothetical protein
MRQILIEKHIELSKIAKVLSMNGTYCSYFFYYNEDGELHSKLGQPAVVSYYLNGVVFEQSWYTNGERNRGSDNPATIRYDKNGQIIFKCWYRKGQLYRIGNKPVIVEYENEKEIKPEPFFDKLMNSTKKGGYQMGEISVIYVESSTSLNIIRLNKLLDSWFKS